MFAALHRAVESVERWTFCELFLRQNFSVAYSCWAGRVFHYHFRVSVAIHSLKTSQMPRPNCLYCNFHLLTKTKWKRILDFMRKSFICNHKIHSKMLCVNLPPGLLFGEVEPCKMEVSHPDCVRLRPTLSDSCWLKSSTDEISLRICCLSLFGAMI